MPLGTLETISSQRSQLRSLLRRSLLETPLRSVKKKYLTLFPLIPVAIAIGIYLATIDPEFEQEWNEFEALNAVAIDLLKHGNRGRIIDLKEDTNNRIQSALAQNPSWRVIPGKEENAILDGTEDAAILFYREETRFLALRMKVEGKNCRVLSYWLP